MIFKNILEIIKFVQRKNRYSRWRKSPNQRNSRRPSRGNNQLSQTEMEHRKEGLRNEQSIQEEESVSQMEVEEQQESYRFRRHNWSILGS